MCAANVCLAFEISLTGSRIVIYVLYISAQRERVETNETAVWINGSRLRSVDEGWRIRSNVRRCAAMHPARETRHESKYHLVETCVAKPRPYKYDAGWLSQYRGTSSRRLFLRPRRKGKVARGCAYQLLYPRLLEECALEWKPATKDGCEKGRKTEIGRMESEERAGERGMRSYGIERPREWTRQTCARETTRVTDGTPLSSTLVSYV